MACAVWGPGRRERSRRRVRPAARGARRLDSIEKVNSANYGMEPASHQETGVGGHVLNRWLAGDRWFNSQQLAVAAPAMCPSPGNWTYVAGLASSEIRQEHDAAALAWGAMGWLIVLVGGCR